VVITLRMVYVLACTTGGDNNLSCQTHDCSMFLWYYYNTLFEYVSKCACHVDCVYTGKTQTTADACSFDLCVYDFPNTVSYDCCSTQVQIKVNRVVSRIANFLSFSGNCNMH
jgi:hypothetical protein